MAIIIGNAWSDENGKSTGGKPGDQKQKSKTNDTIGEVRVQNMYDSSKGWYIIRPKKIEHANAIANLMLQACINENIGYSQSDRYGVIRYGINTRTPCNCDCSSLARECIKEGTGKDPGDFSTANEVAVLAATGLFEDKISYVSQAKTPLYNGDIIVTKTKGHTAIVVSGNPRRDTMKKVTASKKPSSKLTSLVGKYTITSDLNIRDGAGTTNKILTVLPKGYTVSCNGQYSVYNNTRWYYINFIYQNVEYIGFASSKYLHRQ